MKILEGRGEVGEEVGIEGYGEAHHEVGIDASAGEDVVDVAAVAMDLAAQPCHCALLAAQFLFNKFSYVYRLVFECAFVFDSCHINCMFLTLAYDFPISIWYGICLEGTALLSARLIYCTPDAIDM